MLQQYGAASLPHVLLCETVVGAGGGGGGAGLAGLGGGGGGVVGAARTPVAMNATMAKYFVKCMFRGFESC